MAVTHPIILEALYPEMEEATIGRWLVSEGAAVEEGAPLAELITDKVAYEYQSPRAGIILAILPAEKSVTPIGTILAVIGEQGDTVENLADLEAENRRLAEQREASLSAIIAATQAQDDAPAAPQGGQGVRATPAARRLARERNVDLATIHGTGPGGIITVDDIA